MELSAWITLAVLAVMIVVLYTERVAPGPAVLGAVVVLMLIGVITPEQAFSGFSNEAPIIVACLLIVARAVDVAGIMQPIVTRLFRGAVTPDVVLECALPVLLELAARHENDVGVGEALHVSGEVAAIPGGLHATDEGQDRLFVFFRARGARTGG
jgi:hypothetical protein